VETLAREAEWKWREAHNDAVVASWEVEAPDSWGNTHGLKISVNLSLVYWTSCHSVPIVGQIFHLALQVAFMLQWRSGLSSRKSRGTLPVGCLCL
jgi:hypothetical protein